jgi:small subunit ribosomal protein S15Ae
MDKWATSILPSRHFGHIVLTTSVGVIDHDDARQRNVGGKILGYFY